MSKFDASSGPVNRRRIDLCEVLRIKNFLAFVETLGYWLLPVHRLATFGTETARQLQLDRVGEREARVLACRYVYRGDEISLDDAMVVTYCDFLRWLHARGYQIAWVMQDHPIDGKRLRVIDPTMPFDTCEMLNQATDFIRAQGAGTLD